MRDLDDVTFEAFRAEIKTAADWHGAVSGGAAGLGLGALTGGAISAYRGYRQAKERGEETGGALLRGALAAPSGAAIGAVAGGALGAGAGALVPRLGETLARAPVVGAPTRFAQRQVHGFTGWTPRNGIESIGGGAAEAKTHLEEAYRAAERAERGVDTATAAQRAGMTSIPGIVRGLMNDPKGTLQKGFAQQWHGSSPTGRVLALGMPAAEIGHAALAPESPEGPGRGERLGRGLLSGAGGLVTGSLPFAAQLAAGGALGALGGGVGRLVDRARGRRPSPAAVAPPHKDDAVPGGEVRVGPGMLGGGL